jgi:cation diffusion facilitator CzcD-associated flavoprotein CzcO
VVSVTGLALRPQEERAARLGAYQRRPMFARIEPEGVRWADGSTERVDVIVWATGFRAALDHPAPLDLRAPGGGIALAPVPGNVQGATTAVRDPRVQLVGYGPSASTIGAGRAGRQAALAMARRLRPAA